MKINLKSTISVLAVCSMLFIQGCGGGGSGGSGGNGGSGDRGDIGGVSGKFKYDRVSIAGSSITYGGEGEQGGFLGEKSYVGEVEKYLREEIADTINPTELKAKGSYDRNISEPYSYQGELIVYGEGSKISGTLEASDEIVIVYGGSDATVKMEVDGKVCGTKRISGSFKPQIVENPGSTTVDPSLGTSVIASFRRTNEQSVAKICTGLENKKHNFTLTVESGELHLNFITNHMYYMQNAGIGGYRASYLLKETQKTADTTTDQIISFKPDLFILESATNDAQPWGKEDQTSTNDWKIEDPTTCSVDKNKITGLSTSNISKGDVVVIGKYGEYRKKGDEYNGDIKNMAVGIVSSVNGGDIILENNVINYANNEVKGQTICRVKSISDWSDDVKEVVKRVKAGVGSNVLVGIGTSGVPNYWKPTLNADLFNKYSGKSRRLLGYREVGQNLAAEKGWMFFDFFMATMAVNSGVDEAHDDANGNEIPSKWSIGDNTHPNKVGNIIFGKAITDVLKNQ